MAAKDDIDLLASFDLDQITPAQIDMVQEVCGVDLAELADAEKTGKLTMRQNMAMLWIMVRSAGVAPDLEWDALYHGPVGQVEKLTAKLSAKLAAKPAKATRGK